MRLTILSGSSSPSTMAFGDWSTRRSPGARSASAETLRKSFPDLWDRVGEVLAAREVILDGEIVSLNRQGRPVFHDLLRGQGFVAFAAFDLLWLDGRDLRPCPLAERKQLLGTLLPEDTGPLYKFLS